MPTTRQTLFARAVAGGTDPLVAVVQAGYRGPPKRVMRRLMGARDTLAMIAEASAGKVEALQQLEEARKVALAAGDGRGAVLAIRTAARIKGVL